MFRPRLALAIAVCLCAAFVHAAVTTLHVKHDSRNKFFVEKFGFLEDGQFHLSLDGFKLRTDEWSQTPPRVGFMVKRTQTDCSAFLEQHIEVQCLFDTMEEVDFDIPIYEKVHSDDPNAEAKYEPRSTYTHIVPEGQEALYNIYFVNCEPDSSVDFTLTLTLYNPGPNFLSVGDSPIPMVMFFLFILYLVALVCWVSFQRGSAVRVLRIHHLMTILLVLKLLSVLFESIRYHYIKISGDSSGWEVPFYIFDFMKGVMLFMLILLIGTGWTFVKPIVSDRDKKLFIVVLPLQILANVAMVIIEETAPGSAGWVTWFNILRLVDIICCGAILFPIIWSIKHLREASQTDGKAAKNIEKLTLFRQFYILVVSYIYFTRIIKYLLDATLPFRLVWLSTFFSELATFAFYVVTGIKFRPVPDNPYFRLEQDDTPMENMDNSGRSKNRREAP